MSTTNTVMSAAVGWIKSSLSNGNQNCVEVRFERDSVLVRDSKYLRDSANDPAAQPIIEIPAIDWDAFLTVASGGKFETRRDLPAIEREPFGVTVRSGVTTLTYTPSEWESFTKGVSAGEFSAAA